MVEQGRILLVVQVCIFALGRVLDDLTWHDIGVQSQVNLFESLSIGCMLVCFSLSVARKRHIDGIWVILFLRSQLAFFIVWALQATTIILYFSTFACQEELPESELGYFYVAYPGCCLTAVQISLTTLNYSLICNTKAQWAQFLALEVILFGEIIYAGHLMLYYINHLEGKPKDYTIFLLTIVIANQMLMMDLIFRAAFEDRQREEANQKRLIHYARKTFINRKSSRISALELQTRREPMLSVHE